MEAPVAQRVDARRGHREERRGARVDGQDRRADLDALGERGEVAHEARAVEAVGLGDPDEVEPRRLHLDDLPGGLLEAARVAELRADLHVATSRGSLADDRGGLARRPSLDAVPTIDLRRPRARQLGDRAAIRPGLEARALGVVEVASRLVRRHDRRVVRRAAPTPSRRPSRRTRPRRRAAATAASRSVAERRATATSPPRTVDVLADVRGEHERVVGERRAPCRGASR